MKRIVKVMAVAAVAFVSGTVNAQTTSDQVTLNINLNPVYTLIVDGSQKTVDLTYNTREDYDKGVSALKNNHLTVYSTGGFEVKVKTDGDFKAKSGETIDAKSVSVEASNGDLDKNNMISPSYSKVDLSASDTQLISSKSGGVDHKFNVNYTGAANHAYVNKYISGNGGATSVYTSTLTYTILGL